MFGDNGSRMPFEAQVNLIATIHILESTEVLFQACSLRQYVRAYLVDSIVMVYFPQRVSSCFSKPCSLRRHAIFERDGGEMRV